MLLPPSDGWSGPARVTRWRKRRSSVLGGSYEIDGKEVLIPHVSTGPKARVLTNKEALAQYEKTGKHLGKFRTPGAATARARFIHAEQVAMGPKGSKRRKKWKTKQAARRAAARDIARGKPQ